MASGKMSVTIRVTDLATVKLVVLQIRLLADQMRVEANPRAEDLERIIARFEARASGEPED